MSKTPVCKGVRGGSHPKAEDKIDVGNQLSNSTEDGSFLPKVFFCNDFSYTGSKGNVR
jgi:hypothetical protein